VKGNLNITQTHTGGPQTINLRDGSGRTITFRGEDNSIESLSAANVTLFKDMCGLLEYMTKVDPKFAEYATAYRASKKVVE
jgi:hypothetical protein